MPHRRFPGWARGKSAVMDALVLAFACLVTYLLVPRVLSRVYSISKDGDLLGAMWAVVSTIFVIRDSYPAKPCRRHLAWLPPWSAS